MPFWLFVYIYFKDGPVQWSKTVLYAEDLFPEQFRSLFDQKISTEDRRAPSFLVNYTQQVDQDDV